MTRRRLSDQFRDQLGSLGESLATHTRSLDRHLERQAQSLIERRIGIEQQQQQLLASNAHTDDQLNEVLAPLLTGKFLWMTVVELRQFCRSQGLRNTSRLYRAALLKLVRSNQYCPPPLPISRVIKKLRRGELESIVTFFATNSL